MKMISPGLVFIHEVIKYYAASYIEGNCDFNDAIDLVVGDIHEYTESEEFRKEVKYYFKNFVDIKIMGEEEINFD